MAVDRAVLLARERGESPATLRLYRWSRPTVSLGRFQRLDDVDVAACAELGIDVVRRPTGGRGVLHDQELTYSVVAGVADGIPRGTAASYAVLCSALVEAYRRLGVPADLTARDRGEGAAGACYLHATRADLSVGAAKLSGSAQVWSRDTVLQHGSFVIDRDVAVESRVFRLPPAAASRLAETTRTLRGLLGSAPTDERLRQAIVEGFEHALGIVLEPGELSPRESADCERLIPEARVDGST